jgi:DNA-binding transcriptional regulator PaaX
MFFRDTNSKNSKNPTLQLVENFRDQNNKIRQRIIVSLGTNFGLPKELRKKTAEIIEQKLLGQSTLFVDSEINDYAERIIKKIQTDGKWDSPRLQVKKFKEGMAKASLAEVFVDQVEHGFGRILGPVLIGHTFWKRLGLPEILSECGFSEIQSDIAEISVLNRLIKGNSENAIPVWVKTSAISDLFCEKAEDLRKDVFYRISDKLLDNQKKIEAMLYEREQSLFQLNSAIYLYDLTNTYFEGACGRNPKAEYNKNQKEKRSDCPQIVVALVLDGDGFCRKHFVFNGKMSDAKSLEKILDQLKFDFGNAKLPTIIMDRGVTSDDNLNLLKSKGLSYIVACRSGEEASFMEDFDNSPFKVMKSDKNNTVEIFLKRESDETYLLCKSTGRKKKETAMRNQAEKKLENDLAAMKKSIEGGKRVNPAAVERSIGRLKERHRRAAHYYDIKFSPFSFEYEHSQAPKRMINSLWKLKEKTDAHKISHVKLESELKKLSEKYSEMSTVKIDITKPDLAWQTQDEKIEKLTSLDGNYLLKTNRTDLEDHEIWKTYVMLTLIERAFRNLKSHLGLRPNYHHLENRVDGHVNISILAYHLLHSVEHTLRGKNCTTTWPRIKLLVENHTYSTITLPTKKGPIIHLRKPAVPETVHREIYDKLNIDYKNLPVTKIIA